MSFKPGYRVTDHVRLLRPIAAGGMGSVWVGEHVPLETEVAVKFMATDLSAHPESIERFTREARAVARLRSPHVVKVLDSGTTKEDGVPFITMELLEGEDVKQRVTRAGALSVEETCTLVTQLSKALGEAHSLGIVHRDVKPDNVFLTGSGSDLFVKMLDFGLALQAGRSLDRVTCSGTTLGTPISMSPEQLLNAKDVDHRCDLWSLGVVAYYALTARLPFRGETFAAVCMAIDRGLMIRPSHLRPELSPAIDAWFAKALCRQIDGRFQSVKEMSDAFVAATKAPAVPVYVTAASEWSRRILRKRYISAASAAALLALTVGAMDLGRIWFGRAAHADTMAAVAPAESQRAAKNERLLLLPDGGAPLASENAGHSTTPLARGNGVDDRTRGM